MIKVQEYDQVERKYISNIFSSLCSVSPQTQEKSREKLEYLIGNNLADSIMFVWSPESAILIYKNRKQTLTGGQTTDRKMDFAPVSKFCF